MRTAALLAATITVGLMAGLFAAFSYAVMPALRRSADRTFVEAMRQINIVILNGWFMLCFLGGALFSAVAAVLAHGRPEFGWAVAGGVLYLVGGIGVTGAVNVPLNNALEARPEPEAEARERFEARWVRFNLVRTVGCLAAFGCLAWALVLSGRA